MDIFYLGSTLIDEREIIIFSENIAGSSCARFGHTWSFETEAKMIAFAKENKDPVKGDMDFLYTSSALHVPNESYNRYSVSRFSKLFWEN